MQSSSSRGLKRSHSFMRKRFSKKLPLIMKEIENDAIYNTINLLPSSNEDRIILSILQCDLDRVQHYLENGTNPNLKEDGWTLLHFAVSGLQEAFIGTDKQIELIRLLIKYGANINSVDYYRWTPLHHACDMGLTSVIL